MYVQRRLWLNLIVEFALLNAEFSGDGTARRTRAVGLKWTIPVMQFAHGDHLLGPHSHLHPAALSACIRLATWTIFAKAFERSGSTSASKKTQKKNAEPDTIKRQEEFME